MKKKEFYFASTIKEDIPNGKLLMLLEFTVDLPVHPKVTNATEVKPFKTGVTQPFGKVETLENYL